MNSQRSDYWLPMDKRGEGQNKWIKRGNYVATAVKFGGVSHYTVTGETS